MNVTITLVNPGVDTGPFNIYTNADNYITAVATNIAKSALVAGYNATVPALAATVKVESTGTCTSSIYLPIIQPTTTTTTSTVAPTTTTTTTTGPAPTTTTTTTIPATTTTTTTSAPGPTTTTTTTYINYRFDFQVRNQTDTDYGNGNLTLSKSDGTFETNITTAFSLVLGNINTYNPGGAYPPSYISSSVTANQGYVIDRIIKYAYDGTPGTPTLVGTSTYTFPTGLWIMTSTGSSPGQFQTIKIFTRPA
jgi:hypothetical protein